MGVRRETTVHPLKTQSYGLSDSLCVRAVESPDEAQIFRTVGVVVDELYPLGREKLMAKLLANMALEDRSFVATVGTEVVAYAAETIKTRDRTKLSTFWVHENFRRQGIGRALIEFLVERWVQSGIESVHVTVRAGRDSELLALLSRYGFRRIAMISGRYGPGRDEVVLGWTRDTWSSLMARESLPADAATEN